MLLCVDVMGLDCSPQMQASACTGLSLAVRLYHPPEQGGHVLEEPVLRLWVKENKVETRGLGFGKS